MSLEGMRRRVNRLEVAMLGDADKRRRLAELLGVAPEQLPTVEEWRAARRDAIQLEWPPAMRQRIDARREQAASVLRMFEG